MADPRSRKVVAVKVTNANIDEYVKVTNLTSGGTTYAKIRGADRSAIVGPPEDFDWNNGDTVQAEIHGRLNGMVRGKIQAGGSTELVITASADTTTPGADL